jgi:hypothetical protein
LLTRTSLPATQRFFFQTNNINKRLKHRGGPSP